MNCVACNEPMVVLEIAEVEIDHCLACGGVWLDSGEIELLLGDEHEAKKLLQQIGSRENRQHGKRKCPICLKKMEIVIGRIRMTKCNLTGAQDTTVSGLTAANWKRS